MCGFEDRIQGGSCSISIGECLSLNVRFTGSNRVDVFPNNTSTSVDFVEGSFRPVRHEKMTVG